MLPYLAKRLLLIPVTLFFIIIINFVIINLAPGEPVSVTLRDAQGGVSKKADRGVEQDEQYFQFRHFFGLTLPILWNFWPWTSEEMVINDLQTLATKRGARGQELSASDYSALKVLMGDRAPFILDTLLEVANSDKKPQEIRTLSLFFFIRGSMQFGHVGAHLTEQQKEENERVQESNAFLITVKRRLQNNPATFFETLAELNSWYENNRSFFTHPGGWGTNLGIIFGKTRFARYMGRVLKLDFGVLRNNPSRTVIQEVISRLKYSLTLAVFPLIITFILCQVFGLLMAVKQNSLTDVSLNALFLIAWATPVFVVAPFLIDTIALHHNYPFTNVPFPIRGFSSDEALFSTMTSWERFCDILRHLTLPIFSLLYGSLAVESRLSRAIFIDVLSHDYVRTAFAKGLPRSLVYMKHVARNAAIPIVTAVSGSLGAILGGALIIETIFEIHGFGKFFYDAIVNRDYNVMMFSSIMGAFLALVGYLVADIAYMLLDPRVNLETGGIK